MVNINMFFKKENYVKDIITKIYKDSLLKNSVYLMITNFSNLAIGFFFWMLAARYYMPDDIGTISAMLSSIGMISMISTVGLPIALMFYLPRYPKNANLMISSCLIICIIVAALFSFVSIIGIKIWMPSMRPVLEDFGASVIFVAIAILTTMSILMTGTFTAGKKSSFHMVKENTFAITKVIFIVLFSGLGAMGIFLSWSMGLLLAVIIGFVLMHKLWGYVPMIALDPKIKSMVGFTVGSYAANILFNVPRFMFPVMIINLISAEYAGYFFIAMTMAGVLYGVSTSMSGPFLAEVSDDKKLWNNATKAIKFNMGLLIPGSLIFIIFGKFILGIFNPNYAENSFITLIILSMTSFPLSVIVIFNMIRTSQKRIMSTVVIDGALATMTIILAIPFMKFWSIEGAAMAYLVSSIIIAIIIIFRMKNSVSTMTKILNGDRNV